MQAKPRIAYSSEIAEDVARGLSDSPKWLSAKLFYDAQGSALFEQITRLPEYYLTRTEAAILTEYADEMIAAVDGERLSIVELGAGSALKTTIVLDAAVRAYGAVHYYPIDVSAAALQEASARLSTQVPAVIVEPLHLDYDRGMQEVSRIAGRKLVLFIGSSIGNFTPMEATEILANLRRNLGPEDAILLGTDMRKDAQLLVPAYDDAQGVTAAFNKNILMRINRELGADFDLDAFAHFARWNDRQSRIEMHLKSLRAQQVHVPELGTFSFAEGETIHTENSYKFSMRMLDSVVANAGLQRTNTWTDTKRWFTVHLLRNSSKQ
ncbi:MAG TPA: L-histidine N(alpha)-methyltransferase [Terriglobales bacterium]|jgi:dimethylhistidine N-methyltransferase